MIEQARQEADELPHRRSPRRPIAVSLASTLINAALSGGLLVLLSRSGRLEEIADYTVGTVGASAAAALLSAGTSFAYLTGDDVMRRRVLRWRLLVVLPLLIAIAAAVGVFYEHLGYGGVGVATAAAAVAINGVGELQYGDLQRSLRYERAAAGAIVTKAVGAGLALSLLPLGPALLAAALLQVPLLHCLSVGDRMNLHALAGRSAVRPPRTVAPLAAYAAAEYAGSRMDTAALSIVAAPATVGAYGAVYSIFQFSSSLAYAAVSSLIPLRNRYVREPGQERTLRRMEALLVLATVAGMLGVVLVADRIVEVMRLEGSGAATWLRLLALATPFYLVNRITASRLIAKRAYAQAVRVPLFILLAGVPLLVLLLPRHGAQGAAAATLGQELAAAILLGLVALRRALRARRPAGVEAGGIAL